MKVKWTEYAIAQRKQVANYIRRQFGAKRKTQFLQEVRETTKQLRHSPNIGPIAPLYADLTMTYQSVIINGLNKMVYFIKDDIIYIVDFWDTRREPTNQAAKTP